MKKKLKILVLSPEPPYPPTYGGARIRLYHILRQLSQSHDITLFTLLDSPDDSGFLPSVEEFCHRTRAFHPSSQEGPATLRKRLRSHLHRMAPDDELALALVRELQEHAYDLVHVDTGRMAIYTPVLGNIPKIIAATDSSTLGRKTQVRLARRIGSKLRAAYLYSNARCYESRFYRKYDACVVIAQRDRDMIHQLCPELAIHIVPNGVDIDYFQPPNSVPETEGRLLFTGTMDYGPNVDAVSWFVREILPRIEAAQPRVHFEIVGRAPCEEVQTLGKRPNISVTGFVSDLRSHLASAAVYVCPLRYGAGMKNKMLEAMAAAKAIVTTAEGASGLSATAGRECMIADEADAFAAEVVRLLAQPAERKRLGEAARSFVKTRYSWQHTAEQFDALYRKVADHA